VPKLKNCGFPQQGLWYAS